eukprot:133512-Chlamydomonas_euryale.AAC.2
MQQMGLSATMQQMGPSTTMQQMGPSATMQQMGVWAAARSPGRLVQPAVSPCLAASQRAARG